MTLSIESIRPRTQATIRQEPTETLGNLENLPPELRIKCLRHLTHFELAICALVNRSLELLVDDSALWRFLCQRDFPHQTLGAASPKKHYEVCSNIKNGRYLPFGYAFERQKVAVVLPSHNTLNYGGFDKSWNLALYNPQNCSLDRMFIAENSCLDVRWNGTELALKGPDPASKFSTMLIGTNQAARFQRRQTLPVYPLGFMWQGTQLVTVSSPSLLSIWEPDATGKLQLSCSRELREYEYKSTLFAWDGQYLAFCNNELETIQIFKKEGSELKLMSEIPREHGASITCLRWHGNFLFVGNIKGVIYIAKRQENVFEEHQMLNCVVPILDIVFRGNQIFIVAGTTISLWEQNEKGYFDKLHDLFLTTPDTELFFHNHELLFTSSQRLRKHQIRMLAFESLSNQALFDDLTHEFEKTAQFKPPIIENDLEWKWMCEDADDKLIKKGEGYKGFTKTQYFRYVEDGSGYKILKDRFLAMPKSKKQKVFEVLGKGDSKRGEDAFHKREGLSASAADIAQAIRKVFYTAGH